ncbi:double zinc ribbon domain-containing protein [Arenibacterium sp. CAU 1754]
MRGMFQTAVQLLYPPRCMGCGTMVESDFGLCGTCWRDTPFIGGTVCDGCGIPLHGSPDGHRLDCDDCMETPRPWDQGRAALLYKDRARRMVLALKHGDRAEVARPAGVWLARAARPFLKDNMLIAPVPLHRMRLLKRRYNQSALLAQALAHETGLACCPDLLTRTRATSSQDGKTAHQRFENIKGAIVAHPKRRHRMTGRSVLLVDDVMTSGATLAACSEACLNAGARDVFVVVLARVGKDD